MKLVEIVKTPEGEAPLWVRQGWVGLRLPLAQKDEVARTFHGVGVLSGPKTFLGGIAALVFDRTQKVEGYAVDAQESFKILSENDSAAANWWYEHQKEIRIKHRILIFRKGECMVIANRP